MTFNMTIQHALDVVIEENWDMAVDAGLMAAGYVYANMVKRALAGGYTSGDFVTGRVMNSVTVSEANNHVVDVGTDLDYAMYWELGHHNIFTRHFERVEIWGPALEVMGPEMSDVFSGTMISNLLQGPGGTESSTISGGAE